ncbi:CHC2 zinc finger domain-containing protein [Maritalea sp.]|jgi:hypothetical protein|uniref:DUF7146 domain-containing protein n=1 Tax=Maritalea sp. TaxID=2003361 RepID=UPI0039E4AD37
MNLDSLKHEAQNTSCIDWATGQGWKIGARGNDRSGPCPKCGGHEKKDANRFAINLSKNIWVCRGCEKGGDVIALVMHMEDLDFKSALERITGRKAAEPVDPAHAAELQKQAEERRRTQVEFAERERQKQIRAAKSIIAMARPPKPGGPVEQYLRQRGLGKLADTIAAGKFKIHLGEVERFERRCQVKNGHKVSWEVIDTCPMMVGAIVQANGAPNAVHMTYIDVSQPKGKRQLDDPNTGQVLASKIMRGSKKGGAIWLYTPANPKRLVMGEGIETTLTALQEAYQPHTAYWCGVDLGNMAGATGVDAGGTRRHDIPDLEDDAFVPPEWCKEFVILRDADSDQAKTEKQLIRCGRRAMALRPGLKARIADALPGKDFNDMLVEGLDE